MRIRRKALIRNNQKNRVRNRLKTPAVKVRRILDFSAQTSVLPLTQMSK